MERNREVFFESSTYGSTYNTKSFLIQKSFKKITEASACTKLNAKKISDRKNIKGGKFLNRNNNKQKKLIIIKTGKFSLMKYKHSSQGTSTS